MSTECERYDDRLADLAAGRMGPGEGSGPSAEAELRGHLRECARCRAELELLRAIAGAVAEPPAGLEARIRAAVRAGAGVETSSPGSVVPLRPDRRGASWRPWGLPLAAAAAAAALWVGVLSDRLPGGDAERAEVTLAADWDDPFGTWPAADGEVAGAPVLSALSTEELEALLEEMQP